jgi:cytochrome c-type biogenesis protein CcmH
VTASLLASALAATAQQPVSFDAAAYDHATRTILCDCGCHPQSVHECACGRAAQMRGDIRALVEQGMSGDEVVASYVERFGDQIRIAPTATGFNLVAWLGPFAALLLASGLLFVMLSRWSRRREPGAAAEIPVTPEAPRQNDPYHDRLREALEKLE